MLQKKAIEVLEKDGWIVTCESPFEALHEGTGSRVSGEGCYLVAKALVLESKSKPDKPTRSRDSFRDAVADQAEKAVLKLIAEGHWIAPDYANRIKLPSEMLREIWDLVDFDLIKKQMAARLEADLANRLMSHLAAELSTDMKKLLSHEECRKALQRVARDNFKAILGSVPSTVSESGSEISP